MGWRPSLVYRLNDSLIDLPGVASKVPGGQLESYRPGHTRVQTCGVELAGHTNAFVTGRVQTFGLENSFNRKYKLFVGRYQVGAHSHAMRTPLRDVVAPPHQKKEATTVYINVTCNSSHTKFPSIECCTSCQGPNRTSHECSACNRPGSALAWKCDCKE